MGRKLFDGKDYDTVVLKLKQAWSIGAPDQEAAAHAEISDSALCQFLKSHPEISKQKDQLKQAPILSARATLAKSIQKGDGKLALQYLERKLKKEFSTLHEVSGDGTASSIFNIVLKARQARGVDKLKINQEKK